MQTRSFDETWEQPWGERRYVRNRYNEMSVRLTEKNPPGRSFVVVFRVFDDGVGFRYEFPDQPQLRDVNIGDELTEFAIAEPGTAWWIPGGEWNRYEYLYRRTALDEVAQAHTPLTIRTDSGVHIAIHEAALVDYSGMWLRRVDGTRLKAVLSPAAQGAKVKRVAPFSTPWRTLLIADNAGALYMASDIILNLNEPNRLGDVSWFKPAKYVGIWWGMHIDEWSWASGPKHGATTANTRRYIDFAAQHGFRGVLVEGWNVGWDGDWFANGETFSFTQPYPDFDLQGLAEYAKRKGVRLVGHHETSGNIAHYEEQLEAGLDLYQRLGIDSVKTGYVADAGGVKARGDDGKIHFEWHDGQVMSRHHLKVVTEAAKRHIAVVAHEPIKDTGLRRTYPNWVSREGARGMEYNAWGDPPNPPEHEANLVFTRMLSGPFDFTPGVLSLKGKGGQRVPVDDREAAGELRDSLCTAADGRGPARELSPASRAVPVHQGRADRLGADAGAERRSRRLRDHRAQGSQQRRLVPRQRHGRERAHAGSETRLPRSRSHLSRAHLSRRRECRLARAPIRNRHRTPRSPPRRHAAAETRARRRPSDSLPSAVKP